MKILWSWGLLGLAAILLVVGQPHPPLLGDEQDNRPLTNQGRRTDGLPVVVAHRGASGERPEHTLASYRLALKQGADLLEPDLWLSRDGVLVAFHDETLNRITDIAERPQFADRARRDASGQPSWRIYDLTLEELRQLRVRHQPQGRPTEYDRQEGLVTFDELVALVKTHNRVAGTRVGLCPELKQPARQAQAGLDIGKAFLEAVERHRIENDSGIPVVVQCFELETLEALRPKTQLPLQLLVTKRPKEQDLPRIRLSVEMLGIRAEHVLADDSAAWIKDMQDYGLGIYAWTFKNDEAALRRAFAHGVDGVFADFPGVAVAARKAVFPVE